MSCPLRISKCSESRFALILVRGVVASLTVSSPRKRGPVTTSSGIWIPACAGTTAVCVAALSLRRLMGVALHVHVDELERRSGLFQHAPAPEPRVGALHLVERDRRGIADHEPALAQVLDLQRGDLGVAFGVGVDEIMQVGA